MSRDLESLLRFAPAAASESWLSDMRREALAHFEEQGLPTRRLESWKGTSLASLDTLDFARVGPSASSAENHSGEATLVFIDGRFDPEASTRAGLPVGLRVLPLEEALASESEWLKTRLGRLAEPKRNPLVALQTAFLEDAAIVILDAGAKIDRPVSIHFHSTAEAKGASAAFPRLLVVAGEESEATLFQQHVCDAEAPGLTAFVSEFFLSAGARIESVEVQREDAPRIHFTSLHGRLERNARLGSHVFTLGDGLFRSEIDVELAEPGAEVELKGLFVGRDEGHIDHFTTVDHACADCTSDQEYRGVLGDRSEGVFRGRVHVRPDAQRTDARQSNPNLLLSDKASIDSKPQLEIYADDIRASHGSTIGQLDSDALFFLRARGISDTDARLLLTSAFAQTIVDGLADAALRDAVRGLVDDALSKLGETKPEATR